MPVWRWWAKPRGASGHRGRGSGNNDNIKAIVTATREQSLGLQEINQAVSSMDHNTQQNAAMVEQQTAASHALAREASALDEMLAQFKLGSGRAAARSPSSTSGSAAATATKPAQLRNRLQDRSPPPPPRRQHQSPPRARPRAVGLWRPPPPRALQPLRQMRCTRVLQKPSVPAPPPQAQPG